MRLRVLVLFLIAFCAAIAVLARTSPGTSPQPPSAQSGQASTEEIPSATATMLQHRAEDFLRNLYAWGPEFEVKAQGLKPSVLPELYEITVEVSLHGQSDSAVVYITKDGRYMVRGDIEDMNADPFAEIKQKLVIDDAPSKGPKDASTVIVEFGDFQCPSCRQLDIILRKLLPEYPQVRLVFKDFPLEQIHPWAMTAAMVGRCAYQESADTFWKVHDLIYDNQEQITSENAYEKLLQLGTDAGLDSTALRTCVADPHTEESVRKSMSEGANVGVSGTPTSFVNGRTVVGPNEPLLRQFATFTK
jgi:protein-disulfide isomerase